MRRPSEALLRLFLLTALLLVTAVASVLAVSPSEVREKSASEEQFSGERAFETLGRLLGDGRPHPTGSPANRAVRARLEAELRALGLEPQVVRGMACGQYGICAEVENVLAELPGRVRDPAIALGCHYDSVSAGPGAGDDGAGVAALLEIARALHAASELPRSVILVFTDGEEMGLLGARQLVAQREHLSRIGVLVNLEARGVSGPSLMFETSTPNDGLLSAFRRSVQRPVTGSAFYSVYKRLPNDTDLTIFRRAGVSGVNFAFIGGTEHYHTPGDDLERLSRASLQHQGEQALELTRELVMTGVPAAAHDAVFFDLLGRFVVALPIPLFRALALALLVLGAAGVFSCVRRGFCSVSGASLSALGVVVCLVFAALLGVGLDLGLRFRGSLDQPWPENDVAIAVAAGFGALFALTAVLRLLRGRTEGADVFVGYWCALLALTLATTWLLPEAAYLFAMPALAATALSAAALRIGERAFELAAPVTLVVNALFWAPVSALAFDAIGVAAPALPAALAALLLLPLLPFAARLSVREARSGSLAAAAAFVLASGVALATEPRSSDAPARVNLAHQLSADTGKARWLLEAARVPEELAEEGFVPNRDDDFPWFGATLVAQYQKPAPALPRPEPTLKLLRDTARDGARELELELTPGEPDALALELGLPLALLGEVRVAGVLATPVALGQRAVLGVVGPGAKGVRVTLELRTSDRVTVRLAELVSGLPPEARRLVELRDRRATQSQTGDVSIVSRDLSL